MTSIKTTDRRQSAIVESCKRELASLCCKSENVVGDLAEVCFAFPSPRSGGLWSYSFLVNATWTEVGAVVAGKGKDGDPVVACCCAQVFHSEVDILTPQNHASEVELWWDGEYLGSIIEDDIAACKGRKWTVYSKDHLFGEISAAAWIGSDLKLRSLDGQLMTVRVSRTHSLYDMVIPLVNALSLAWLTGRRLCEPIGDFVIPDCTAVNLGQSQKRLIFAIQLAFRCIYFLDRLWSTD